MMQKLRWVSWAMTATGVALAAGAIAADMGAALLLAGVLLAWAGVVKIIVVHLWMHVAGLGTDRHDPIHTA
jgi:hypothetical protein